MAVEADAFVGLLQQLLSENNDARNAAEKSYQSLSMSVRVPALLNAVGSPALAADEGTVIRTLAAVLLRRVFVNEYSSFEKEASVELFTQAKSILLQLIERETQPLVRRRICDAVAEFARCQQDDSGNNLWPEVLSSLFQFGRSERGELREAALHIIASTPTVFGEQRNHYMSVIKSLLVECMSDPHTPVSYAACKATAAFLGSLRNDAGRNGFVDMIPGMVQVTAKSVSDDSVDDSLLQSFLDFCQRQPKMLRGCLEQIVILSLKIAGTTDLEDKVRQLGLEIVVTLAEEAPAMIRKRAGNYLQNIVQQILSFMVDVEDDDNWADQDTPDQGDETTNSVYGEAALDRLAMSLGGKCILPLVMVALGPMLASPKWEHRYGALLAVSAMAEGCHKQMLPHLQEILTRALPFLQDSHPRVRFSACNAIGQMGIDLAQDIQRKYHSTIIPAILMVIESPQTARVQEHAFSALINFVSYLPQNLLIPYLSPICIKVEELFGRALDDLVARGRTMVLQAIILLITTLADVADKHFEPHYDRFMPRLKFLLENAVSDELRTLRGKAIECITTIGAAAPEKLRPDVEPIMVLLVRILKESNSGEMDPSDPQISYMISAWPRMASILQHDFVPYLGLVLPMTIAAAELQPEVVIVESEEAKAQFDEKDGWQFMTLTDQQRFGLKTAGLQEKATAVDTITSFVRELGVGFADHAPQIANVMCPLLKFYFDESVRQSAAECLPLLLSSVKPHGDEAMQSIWIIFREELFSACAHEPDRQVLSAMLCSLSDCVDVLGSVGFNTEVVSVLMGIILARVTEHFSRHEERLAQKQEEDHDEDADEDLEMERESDEQVLGKITDVLHALFAVHRASLLPFFDSLVPFFTRMLEPGRTYEEHQWALCVFDDVIEFGGRESVRYQQFFLEPMIAFILDASSEVRQAAAYGVGIMALHGGEAYYKACVSALPRLAEACSMEVDPSDYMSCCANENCISAVAKICRTLPEGVLNLGDILPHWLSWLPIINEEEEAPFVYEYLCELIMQNNVYILGEEHVNLPRIVRVFARALGSEVLADAPAIVEQMITILKQVRSSPDTWQAILGLLPEDERAVVEKLCTA
eukprot:scpid19596/ scgid32881/ Importin-5; Importin subunit beta-3; Karyopherin beta-3; Ran-binding protein 5